MRGASSNTYTFGNANQFSVTLQNEPFRLDFYVAGKLVISANERQLLKFEQLRHKEEPAPTPEVPEEPKQEGGEGLCHFPSLL